MSRKIWQPEHPTPGWLQAERDSDLTFYLPHPDGDVPMFFRRIPAGEFRMGSRGNDPSEEPVHRVVIPQDFHLGTFPVTQAQYRAMLKHYHRADYIIYNNEVCSASRLQCDLRPVKGLVSWDEATTICRAISTAPFFQDSLEKMGLANDEWQTGLPCEALWEYACRAGTETDYINGDGETALNEVGWFDEDSTNSETHPVGELPANKWGLYDMHGNTWEWCADVYDAKAYRKRVDGWTAAAWSGEDAGKDAALCKNAYLGVIRGGSTVMSSEGCRSAHRRTIKPGYFIGDLAFRVCVFRGSVKQKPESEKQADYLSGDYLRRNDLTVEALGDGSSPVDQCNENACAANGDENTGKTPPHPETPRGAWRNGCGGAPSSNEPSHE
jgi:formylglycine-generating enzyme required for sulfatase activity